MVESGGEGGRIRGSGGFGGGVRRCWGDLEKRGILLEADVDSLSSVCEQLTERMLSLSENSSDLGAGCEATCDNTVACALTVLCLFDGETLLGVAVTGVAGAIGVAEAEDEPDSANR